MSYGNGRSDNYPSTFFDGFTLSPLPYPVLFILLMVLLLLGMSWSSTYEEIMEEAEQRINWLLLATPILLLLLIRWLDSFDVDVLGWFYPYDRRQPTTYYYGGAQPSSSEGGSPWGVAAVVVLVLVLVSFKSTIQDMWGG